MNDHYYRIANLCFAVKGEKLIESIKTLPGFNYFRGNNIQPEFYFKESKKKIIEIGTSLYQCKINDIKYMFYTIPEGYLLILESPNGQKLYTWNSKKKDTILLYGYLMPSFVNYAMWLFFGVMTIGKGVLPIHSSCIVQSGIAYIFLGESGTGKSTHTKLWLEHIPNTELLNDDSPIIKMERNNIFVYGSPWSGKTDYYKQEKYPLGGCVRLSQASKNHIYSLSTLQAYAAIHPSCPPFFCYDNNLYNYICTIIDKVISSVPIFKMECLPNKEAAIMALEKLSSHNKTLQKDFK